MTKVIKPDPHLGCVRCGKMNRAPHPKGAGIRLSYCLDDKECQLAYQLWVTENNVVPDGDCLIWTGPVNMKSARHQGVPSFDMTLGIGKKYRARPRWVLAKAAGLITGPNDLAMGVCPNDPSRCVALDHIKVQTLNAASKKQERQNYGPKLPSGPLVAFYDREMSLRPRVGASLDDWHRETVSRARRRGWIKAVLADTLCIDAFGVHPVAIWGFDFFREDDYEPEKAA